MVRIEVNKKQLKYNFVDAFFYASWIYIVLAVVGAVVGAVGLAFGIVKSMSLLVLGIAFLVMGVLALCLVCFYFITIYFVFFGNFKKKYPNGVKIFEISRVDVGVEIHNVVQDSSAILQLDYIAKIVKTKRSILIRLKKKVQ